ncbi:MAG: sulfur carrier protein ThiS [Deltaproteobacteria bacterium]|jgi:sulfur carrier protein|nr:sulfur carrier protein ThiS [Deltaproteobacteria bacterium]
MELTISGTTKTFPDDLSVTELLEAEQVATPQYVTVSINEELVDQGSFDSRKLASGDKVEFLYFMGGGTRELY